MYFKCLWGSILLITGAIRTFRSVANKARETNAKIYKETDKHQLENRDRLSERAGVVYGWKSELERALVEITDEIELLENERRRVKQSLSVLTVPESIAGDFLQLRSTRLEPDLVRDPVEDELVKVISFKPLSINLFSFPLTIILYYRTRKLRFALKYETPSLERVNKQKFSLSN